MPKFAAGVVRFQNEVYPHKQALFEKLSHGQAPEALFITCSDSRIETAMMTQTEPGELFVYRNAGNIVPPHTTRATGLPSGGMAATIEYAVAALNVPHIVICGHSDCGAMKGALNPESLEALPDVKDWLVHSKAAVESTHALGKTLSEAARIQCLIEQNVILQLQHLKTHPQVAQSLTNGNVTLHGWVYDIKSGAVTAYDDDQQQFVPLNDHYAEEISRHMTKDCPGG